MFAVDGNLGDPPSGLWPWQGFIHGTKSLHNSKIYYDRLISHFKKSCFDSASWSHFWRGWFVGKATGTRGFYMLLPSKLIYTTMIKKKQNGWFCQTCSGHQSPLVTSRHLAEQGWGGPTPTGRVWIVVQELSPPTGRIWVGQNFKRRLPWPTLQSTTSAMENTQWRSTKMVITLGWLRYDVHT